MDPNRRSASPDRRRPKELSFYKKSSSSSRGSGGGHAGAGAVGSFSSRRDPLDRLDDRRRAGAASAGVGGSAGGAGDDVPGRYGGSRGEYTRPGPARSGRDDDRHRDRDRGGRSDRYDTYPRQSDRPSYQTNRDRDRDDTAPGEYKGGEPLRRVPTRDERDQGSSASVYRGGDDLRRVETRNEPAPAQRSAATAASTAYGPMIEIIANDRLGRKVRVKCLPSDTVGDLKKLIAAQTGTIASKIQLKKWYTTYKDHIELRDYEINDGMSLEMY